MKYKYIEYLSFILLHDILDMVKISQHAFDQI